MYSYKDYLDLNRNKEIIYMYLMLFLVLLDIW